MRGLVLTLLACLGLGLYGNEVRPSTFPLPTLGLKLLRLAYDIHNGKGFAAVRGLRPEEFSPEDNIIVFLGISSYIGAKRGRQDEEGNMLSELLRCKLNTTMLRPYTSARPRCKTIESAATRQANEILI